MSKRDKQPPAIVSKTKQGIRPVSAFDLDCIMSDPIGTEYDLVKRSGRSLKHLRTYWKMLSTVVSATGAWPTKEHLSDEIKLTLGYRRQLADLRTGEVTTSVDSIAFDKMTHDEFVAYFNSAHKLLIEKLDFDPLAFLEEAA